MYQKKCYISIVVPVYNADQHLRKLIKSVIAQSHQNWQLILVDDGSTDHSADIIKKYLSDTRIHYIYQENSGPSAARKLGIESVWSQDAECFLLCDADDVLPKDCLEKMYRLMKREKVDIVCGATKRIWHGIVFKARYHPQCFQIPSARLYTKSEIKDELLISFYGISNFPVSLWGKLYRASVLRDAFSTPIKANHIGEDLCISLQCLLNSNNILVMPDVVYLYRFGGITSKYMPHMMDDFLEVYRFKEALIDQYGIPHDARKFMDIELINCFHTYLVQCKRKGNLTNHELTKMIEEYYKVPELIYAGRHTIEFHPDNHFAKNVADGLVMELLDDISKEADRSVILRGLDYLLKK